MSAAGDCVKSPLHNFSFPLERKKATESRHSDYIPMSEKFLKLGLDFFRNLCYYMQVLRGTTRYPGVAKFGSALEWGSRGLEFESRHSDQEMGTAK